MRVLAALLCLVIAAPALAEDSSPPKMIDMTAGQEGPSRPRDGKWEWTRPETRKEPAAPVKGDIAGRWILPGGDCRTPDLILSAGGNSVQTRSHSASDDGAGGTSTRTTYTYSYSSDGSADNAAKRRVDALLGGGSEQPAAPPPSSPSASALPPPAPNYAIADGQLVVSSFGARKVYQRCDGERPAR
jgi:hypothetical protein